jgi:hypothetical protein
VVRLAEAARRALPGEATARFAHRVSFAPWHSNAVYASPGRGQFAPGRGPGSGKRRFRRCRRERSAMDRREYYYAREFLNLPRHGASAHVIAEVAEEKQGDEWWEEITLVIAACNRITSFDLTTEEQGRENTFYKLDRLISVLQGLRDAITQLAAERDKRRSTSKGSQGSGE